MISFPNIHLLRYTKDGRQVTRAAAWVTLTCTPYSVGEVRQLTILLCKYYSVAATSSQGRMRDSRRCFLCPSAPYFREPRTEFEPCVRTAGTAHVLRQAQDERRESAVRWRTLAMVPRELVANAFFPPTLPRRFRSEGTPLRLPGRESFARLKDRLRFPAPSRLME